MNYICNYVLGAPNWAALPDNLGPEIAFWGRSNVGKSSLLNVLMGHRLARTSKRPGCTQMIHFYRINPYLFLADLPGYGYAQAPRVAQQRWEKFIPSYISQRANLWHIYLLIDARHPLQKADQGAIAFIKGLRKPCTALLTKADALSPTVLAAHEDLFKKEYPWLSVYSVSAKKKKGLEPIWAHFDFLRGVPTAPCPPPV